VRRWTPGARLQATLDLHLNAGAPWAERQPRLHAALMTLGWTVAGQGDSRVVYVHPRTPVALKVSRSGAQSVYDHQANRQEAAYSDWLRTRRTTGPDRHDLFPVLWAAPGHEVIAMPRAGQMLNEALELGEEHHGVLSRLQTRLRGRGLSDLHSGNFGRLKNRWALLDYNFALPTA